MPDINAISLFCEDVREETNGQYSLIGVLGDNISVPQFPGMMPKLAIYVRINLAPTWKMRGGFDIYITPPNGEREILHSIEGALVKDTISKIRKAKNPVAGIYSHIVLSPLPVQSAGRLSLELQWSNGVIFLGSLNFKQIDSAPLA
jgi:hypothetical protein